MELGEKSTIIKRQKYYCHRTSNLALKVRIIEYLSRDLESVTVPGNTFADVGNLLP